MLVLLTVCDLLVDVWAFHMGLWEGHSATDKYNVNVWVVLAGTLCNSIKQGMYSVSN